MRWIGRHDACLAGCKSDIFPAPYFRHEFKLSAAPVRANVRICGLGYFELRLNGEKVSDDVLAPHVTIYDKRARFVSYDVANQLTEGRNAIGVVLGNGWYNCFTQGVWQFSMASWRDYPKLWFILEAELPGGEIVKVHSGPEWRVGRGPIQFDALRNGETYDARLEIPGWDQPGFDDSSWPNTVVIACPGGIMEEQTSPPCKVMKVMEPQSVQEIEPGVAVFDLGQNIAGWARLQIQGEAGSAIVMRYAEKLADDGQIDQGNINGLVHSGDFQTDRYFLKGDGIEVWEPRFTYHGFRYVQIEGLTSKPRLDMLRGCVVHTAFEKTGEFSCSDETVNRLQHATEWSYIGNFVGIPTDCPHREKNGWTGDAQLACETGLMNYDAASSYQQWLTTMADTQRLSGQFPGIVPSSGWGYNWGNGPAWDAAYILIPGYIHLYTGDDTTIRDRYDGMRRYMDYCADMANDHLLSFGLGDWCAVDDSHKPNRSLTSTAYYYVFATHLARYADLLGYASEATAYRELALKIRNAFNATFYHGDGLYAEGQVTAFGCAIYQGLVEDDQREATVKRLVAAVEGCGCKPDFGILGAKYVPRVLADNGHADLAYTLITQPDYPGWLHWLNEGATTLWEDWHGKSSRNHIMFGDISAWFYHYLAGIKPDPSAPGFRHVRLSPCCISSLDWVKASHRSPFGLISSSWRRKNDTVEFDIELPQKVTASFAVDGQTSQSLTAGRHTFALPTNNSRRAAYSKYRLGLPGKSRQ